MTNGNPMRAWVCRRYGGPDVLEIAESPRPAPKPHEVLIRIYATTVTSGDWRCRTLTVPRGLGLVARLMLGFTRPRQPILGSELAGIIEAIGSRVTRFKAGDPVLAFPGAAMGCHAEYRVLHEEGLIAPMPENLTFAEAATLPFGGTTALDFFRKAGLTAGEQVLIVGASGAVGGAMVQLAKHFGAEVTAITSAANVALVNSLGADITIDYTRENFMKRGDSYDIIADTVGIASAAHYKPLLKKNGRLLAIAGGLPDLLATLRTDKDGKRVIAGPAAERVEDVRLLAELAATGALRPVIDRHYPFADMPAAHGYVETRRKRGGVVVNIMPND